MVRASLWRFMSPWQVVSPRYGMRVVARPCAVLVIGGMLGYVAVTGLGAVALSVAWCLR